MQNKFELIGKFANVTTEYSIKACIEEGINLPPKDSINFLSELSNNLAKSEVENWWSHMDDAAKRTLITICTRNYGKYIVEMENYGLAHLLEMSSNAGKFLDENLDDQSRKSYDRVSDAFLYANVSEDFEFTLVGCGKLPVTAMRMIKDHPNCRINCLDISPEAIVSVQKLKETFGWVNINAIEMNGSEFDFSQSDVIFIANMVVGKKDILQQINLTAKSSSHVILRDPYGLGFLWAESVAENLPKGFSVERFGVGSHYLSRNVFLNFQKTL